MLAIDDNENENDNYDDVVKECTVSCLSGCVRGLCDALLRGRAKNTQVQQLSF